MENRLPIVFMVEDELLFQMVCRDVLKGTASLLEAMTLKEAEDLFHRLPEVAIVVMDGCVPGTVLNTLPLVKRIRRVFTGPMIASSVDEKYRKALLKAGCTHARDKGLVPTLLLELLPPLPSRQG